LIYLVGGHDLDFANVLTRCAADPLCGVIVDRLGGEEEDDFGGNIDRSNS